MKFALVPVIKQVRLMPRTRKKPRPEVEKSLFSEPECGILLADEVATIARTDASHDIGKRCDPYSRFYAALRHLRKEFHRIGRFDDANAKLDELCKLLVLKVLDARHPVRGHGSRLSSEYLKRVAIQNCGDESRLASAMHSVYHELTDRFPDEMMAFGSRNGLNLSPDDDEFAAALLPLFDALPQANIGENDRWSFDSVNEAFGHFIQDSFRNRKEDAQYMTPPEVVSTIVDIAIQDIILDLAGDAGRLRHVG
jgi:hypothetical protein